MAEKLTRREKFGIQCADLVMEAAHQTYNADRGKKMVLSCIERLQTRIHEIQSKKATAEYKKARYANKK